MALGGHCGGGRDPAMPAAPLALAAGWRTSVTLTPDLVPAALSPSAVATLDWHGRTLWVECRQERILAWSGDADRPELVADLSIAGRQDRRLLAMLAPVLRRLQPVVRPRASQRT